MRKKCLIIGLDGVRPDALAVAETPNVDALIASGTYTDSAQTCAITVSGPAWASLLTAVDPAKHGVVSNTFQGARYDLYPTLFDRLRNAIPSARTASVVNWAPINTHIVRKADTLVAVQPDERVAEEVVRILEADDPDLLFVQLDEPDAAGHSHVYSPESVGYLRQLAKTDAHIGSIVSAMRRRASDDEDWLVIVTTDHGGSEKGHGKDIPEHRTIFVLLVDSKTRRNALDGGVTIMDVGATALAHLGVTLDPAWNLDGRVVGFES
jgi:predicted AlkP superfamily pyrophosphatase or phosphodiesterase